MEEIIIDGVNVAECEFYDNGSCRECDMRVPFYSDIDCYDKCNKECYYKQLKRLEQENADLKKELQKYKDMEAKGLEEFKDVGGCWGCGIQSASDQYFNEAKKYRHTLEEIKGIEINAYYSSNLEPMSQMQLMRSIVSGYEQRRIRILDKINEVLND